MLTIFTKLLTKVGTLVGYGAAGPYGYVLVSLYLVILAGGVVGIGYIFGNDDALEIVPWVVMEDFQQSPQTPMPESQSDRLLPWFETILKHTR